MFPLHSDNLVVLNPHALFVLSCLSPVRRSPARNILMAWTVKAIHEQCFFTFMKKINCICSIQCNLRRVLHVLFIKRFSIMTCNPWIIQSCHLSWIRRALEIAVRKHNKNHCMVFAFLCWTHKMREVRSISNNHIYVCFGWWIIEDSSSLTMFSW